MALDISQIPESSSPFRSKVSLLMQASATVISVISFVAILVIVCNKEKKQENGRWQRFEICVLLSVCLSVIIQVFDLFSWSNFLISWDYTDSDASFVTAVDGYTVVLWIISKSAFYLTFNAQIDQYFKSFVDETKRRKLHIVLVVIIICLFIVAAMIVYNDISTAKENEMLVINEWLIMVNPRANLTVINVLAHFIVAIVDMTYFALLTLAYRSVYNSNSAEDKDQHKIGLHKITAKRSNGLMLLSTILTMFTMIILVTEIPGRWAVVWAVVIDDICVVILLLQTHQNHKHNGYSAVCETEDQEI